MSQEAWMTKELEFNSQQKKILYLFQNIQSSCGAHTASYLMGKVGCFPSKHLGHEVGFSHPT
jgi:hypothetical protein